MERTNSYSVFLVASTLLLCGVAGGCNFILIKALVGTISPMQLVAGRVALAALALFAVLLVLRRLPRINAGLLRGATILAVIDAIVPYSLIALAAPHVLASTSAVLVSTMPIFTASFVSVADKTRVPMNAVVGLAIGACGVVILAGPEVDNFRDSSVVAMLAVIAAAVSYAVAAVYSRAVLRVTDPIELSAVKFALASAILLPFVSLREGVGSFAELDLTGWLSLLGLGLFVTGLVRCGYVWVIKTAGSVAGSLLTYVVPASALGLGFLFMGESMSWGRAAGISLVGVSVTLTLFGSGLIRLVGLEKDRQFARLRG